MLEPSYPSAEEWLRAVERCSRAGELRCDALSSTMAVARAEAERADATGITTATAHELALAVGMPLKEVRLIRARLIDAGLVSITGQTGPDGRTVRMLQLA